MSELLTTKQLQELLKIDRITVYRMLNDGRLKGIKIGNQWRFTQEEVNGLLGVAKSSPVVGIKEELPEDFPSDCVQRVQEIFAGIIGIGAMTITLDGVAVTHPTFSNPFCRLMLASPSASQACQASWRRIALHTTGQPTFQVCHAGLCYQRSIVNLDDQPAAWLIAGQFYVTPPEPQQEFERLEFLAEKHGIGFEQLVQAVKKVPVLKKYQQEQVADWTPKVAEAIQAILYERTDLMYRMQKIAELSTFRSVLTR